MPIENMTSKPRPLTLPNQLVILRLALGPVVCLCLFVAGEPAAWCALFFYAVALMTDVADGRIARQTDSETRFGRAMDSVADKILMCGALIGLVRAGEAPLWSLLIVVTRELIIGGLRTIRLADGLQIGAINDLTGRTRETLFKVCFSSMMLHHALMRSGLMTPRAGWEPAWNRVNQILLLVSLVLCVLFLVYYVFRDLKLIRKAFAER
jgi:CDP-diacylglycerol--glycerol-3-phosphate 3-phosphatidyltransferase